MRNLLMFFLIVLFLSACFANREKINKPGGEELYRLNINIEASTWGERFPNALLWCAE